MVYANRFQTFKYKKRLLKYKKKKEIFKLLENVGKGFPSNTSKRENNRKRLIILII